MYRRRLLALAPALFVETAPVRILVVTGGHAFDRSFFDLFRDQPGWKWEHREHRPKSTSTVYAQPLADDFDAVVLYDMVQDIASEEQRNFLDLFESGRGVVVLHHALCSYERWPEYAAIAGIRLTNKFPGPLPKMVWKHDVPFVLDRVAAAHPVLDGIPASLPVFDETYGNLLPLNGSRPLLVTNHETSMPVVAWTRTHRKSRVVAIQPGHGPQIFADRHYRRLLANAIRWVVQLSSAAMRSASFGTTVG